MENELKSNIKRLYKFEPNKTRKAIADKKKIITQENRKMKSNAKVTQENRKMKSNAKVLAILK